MNLSARRALLVLSGGQDSTISLFIARQLGYELHAVTFDYGQRHAIEVMAAQVVGTMGNVKSHEFCTLPKLKGRSPLTDKTQPLEQYADHATMEQVIGNRTELTFVPMRNPLFMTIAANRAIADDINTIVVGVCSEDNANYHDCTPEFISIFTLMTREALGISSFKVFAPLLYVPKSQSIKYAINLKSCYETLAYSHTAYDGSYPPTGHDHATVLRAHGFEEAGVPDPLIVRAWLEDKTSLPETENYAAFYPVLQEIRDALGPGEHTPLGIARAIHDLADEVQKLGFGQSLPPVRHHDGISYYL